MALNAVSAETGVNFAPARRLETKQFELLQSAGVIKPARSGYYIDIPAYDAWSRARHKREVLVLTIVLLVLSIGAIVGAIVIAQHP